MSQLLPQAGTLPRRARAAPAIRRAGELSARIPAWAITAGFGLLYVILAPASTDLAAAAYRSDLFARAGFTLWDNSWYGGHHLPAYSVLAPALSAAIGPQLLAAISMTAATALFTSLISGLFPRRAVRIGSVWFAVGATVSLLSSRVPFDLGLAAGLGALVLARRGRPGWGLALAIVTSLASPVAGAFLALACVAWALAGPARRSPAALAAGALAPIVLLAVVFPEGGTQPFVASAFYPALAAVVLIALLVTPEMRALRIGAFLYAAALIGSYLISTAVGGNVDRLGALIAGPVAACILAGSAALDRRALSLIVLAPALLYWQANAPVADFAAAASDPAVKQSYYTPFLGELRALGVGYTGAPARIEVVPTVDHWEARWVAPQVMLARGWERQLDRQRNGLFYASTPVTAAGYRAWLSQQAVSYVALPDAPLDYSAKSEASLVRGGLASYLVPIWSSSHWRLFAVSGARGLASAPAALTEVGQDSFTLRAPRSGTFLVRLHYTPYWALLSGHGCVQRAPGDWTAVSAPRPGLVRVGISFSLARVFGRGPRCR